MHDDVEVTNIAELDEQVQVMQRELNIDGLMYRGVASKDFQLCPRGCRDYFRHGESELFHNFRRYATSRIHTARLPARDSEWLCLMQHYGLATRLLDWTESPIIAAFFALCLEDKSGCDAAIWLLNGQCLNKKSIGKFDIWNLASCFDADDYWNHKRTYIAAVASDEIDVRVSVQRGMFTVHHIEKPLDEHEGSPEFLKRLIIPNDAKQGFRSQLQRLGISRRNLFPDLTNLALDLNEEYR